MKHGERSRRKEQKQLVLELELGMLVDEGMVGTSQDLLQRCHILYIFFRDLLAGPGTA